MGALPIQQKDYISMFANHISIDTHREQKRLIYLLMNAYTNNFFLWMCYGLINNTTKKNANKVITFCSIWGMIFLYFIYEIPDSVSRYVFVVLRMPFCSQYTIGKKIIYFYEMQCVLKFIAYSQKWFNDIYHFGTLLEINGQKQNLVNIISQSIINNKKRFAVPLLKMIAWVK